AVRADGRRQDRRVVRQGGEGWGRRPEPALLTAPDDEGPVPDPRGALAPPGQRRAPVAAEGHRGHTLVLPWLRPCGAVEARDLLLPAFAGLPEPGGAIVAAGQRLAVRRVECHCDHEVVVAEGAQFPGLLDVPKPGDVILAPDQGPTSVRAE